MDVPSSQTERIALMKRLTANWAEPFKSLVHNIPDDSEVVCINLEDWFPERGAHGEGRVALIGDAAHSMTMCKSLIPVLLSRDSLKKIFGKMRTDPF